MPTPDERLRSLLQTRDLLEQLCNEWGPPEVARCAARAAMRNYPSVADIDNRLKAADARQVEQWGRSLTAARAALEEVLHTATDESPLWRQALAAERHFPEACYLPDDAEGRAWIAGFLEPLRELANRS